VASAMSTVEVCVRDLFGFPVVGAAVTLTASRTEGTTAVYRSDRGFSGSDGCARFLGLAADTVAVGAWRRGLAPAWLPALPLHGESLAIELVLGAGLPLDVEIVDERGQPRDVDTVEIAGTPVLLRAEHLATGSYRFTGLPEGTIGIVATDHARTWRIEHDLRVPVAQLVIPRSGALSVTWQLPIGACSHPQLFVFTEPAGWGNHVAVDETAFLQGGPVLIEGLAPGDYRVELRCSNGVDARCSGSATVGSGLVGRIALESGP
jgi:hypothetical protein